MVQIRRNSTAVDAFKLGVTAGTDLTPANASSPVSPTARELPYMSPTIADTTDNYYHVRFNDPEQFDDIRTPDWAENAASSVADDAEVRTGYDEDGDDSDWNIQSVLVPTDEADDNDEAVSMANDIVDKIES